MESRSLILATRSPRIQTGHRHVYQQHTVLPFPLRASLNRVDDQLDQLIYQAFPQSKVA